MNRSATNPTNPTMNRRTFLKRTGATTLVLVTGGSTYRAVDQGVFASGTGPAYEPWRDWRSAPERGPLRLVQSAILAANPHNTQPWLFRVREGSLELFADTSRNLGAMDPFLREMHLGLGCALENMMLTAGAEGYEVDLKLESGTLTKVTPRDFIKVATLNLTPSEADTSPLYKAIPKRHTDRSSYSSQEVERETLEAVTTLTGADTKLFLFEEGASFNVFGRRNCQSHRSDYCGRNDVSRLPRLVRQKLARGPAGQGRTFYRHVGYVTLATRRRQDAAAHIRKDARRRLAF